MTEKVESLCRPDDNQWCVEYCYALNCCIFKKLEDGKRGCEAHGGKLSKEGFSQRKICKTFYCLSNETPETIGTIRDKILSLPPGEFKISQVLKSLDIKLH